MRILVSRREFLRHLLSAGALASISSAGLFKLESWADGEGPPVVWLEGAGCSGCLISLANYFDSASGDGFPELLAKLDLNYAPLFMTASGEPAISQLLDLLNSPSKHILLLVSGAIPSREGYCTVGSFESKEQEFKQILVGAARSALRVAGVGSCACYGGVLGSRAQEPRFAPLDHYLPPSTSLTLLPGCPPHPDWIVTTLVGMIAGENIPLDRYKRPLSLFGKTVCSQCARLPEKQAERFARDPYDPELCLKTVGCRGEVSHCDTPSRGWNGTDSWCVSRNTICVGCTEPFFPETPFVTTSQEGSTAWRRSG